MVFFRDLKARSKVRMKHFKIKMTEVYYVEFEGAIKNIANCRLHFRGFKVLEGVIK